MGRIHIHRSRCSRPGPWHGWNGSFDVSVPGRRVSTVFGRADRVGLASRRLGAPLRGKTYDVGSG